MTRRIRVLLLITELNIGGAERIVQQLATRLPRDRYDVTVACLYDPSAIAADIQAADIPVIDLEMRRKVDLRAPYRLLGFLRQRDIHILHTHLFHANLLGAIVGTLTRTPIIIATRHSMEIGGVHREWMNRLVTSLRDAVVTVSPQVHKVEVDRAHASPTKIADIPGGVEVRAYRVDPNHVDELKRSWDLETGDPVVGTVGRLVDPKGHGHLLDALAKVRSQIAGVKALLVGDGTLRTEMERRAEALGLSDTVIFTGIRRDVPEVLALLDVFVLPSLWEGLPIALLEAMAAGLPVVATRVGGVPEVVVEGETGLLVPPRDPEALAQAILTLLRDPDLRQAMGQAGRERVREHFSVDQMVKKTESLYQRLLAEKGLA